MAKRREFLIVLQSHVGAGARAAYGRGGRRPPAGTRRLHDDQRDRRQG